MVILRLDKKESLNRGTLRLNSSYNRTEEKSWIHLPFWKLGKENKSDCECCWYVEMFRRTVNCGKKVQMCGLRSVEI